MRALTVKGIRIDDTIAEAFGMRATAVVVTAVFYHLRCSRRDFAVLFAALWLISDIAIGIVSPMPLPTFLVIVGFVPALLVGAVLHWQRFVRRHERLAWPSARKG